MFICLFIWNCFFLEEGAWNSRLAKIFVPYFVLQNPEKALLIAEGTQMGNQHYFQKACMHDVKLPR